MPKWSLLKIQNAIAFFFFLITWIYKVSRLPWHDFFEGDKGPDNPSSLFPPHNPSKNFQNLADSGYGKHHQAVFEKSGISFEMFQYF